LDAATSLSVDETEPTPTLSPGDLTACAGCGAVLAVTDAGFRLATADDLAALDDDLRALLLQFVANQSARRGAPH
jgi:hypothetical protein